MFSGSSRSTLVLPREATKRPFLARSSAFNAGVPRKKCFGFTQLGLSHVCRISQSPGSTPFSKAYITRGASSCTPNNFTKPRP